MPTLSDIPPVRTHAVIVVVIVVVNVAIGRNARKNTTHNPYIYFFSAVLQAIAIYFTSDAIFDQYSADFGFSISRFIDNSIYVISLSQLTIALVIVSHLNFFSVWLFILFASRRSSYISILTICIRSTSECRNFFGYLFTFMVRIYQAAKYEF